MGCASDVTWRGVCETRGRRVGTARRGVASRNVKMYCNAQGAKAENRHVSAACPIRAASVLQARSSTWWCVAEGGDADVVAVCRPAYHGS